MYGYKKNHLACRTGVIFLRFSGERAQAQGEREVRDTRDGRGTKKITPVHQPLFMLFRPQTHPQITNQSQRYVSRVAYVAPTERPPAKMNRKHSLAAQQ